MENENRFRAWDRLNQCYIYIDTYYKMHLKTEKYKERAMVLAVRDFWYMALSHGWVIEQCTGLKDKHGKPIYAGDIVKWATSMRGVVKYGFVEHLPCFYCEYISDKIMKIKTQLNFFRHDKDMEIIGNRFENKKLLGEVKS